MTTRNRTEVEERLLEIAREIEAAQTKIWLCEVERELLRHELRRLISGEGSK